MSGGCERTEALTALSALREHGLSLVTGILNPKSLLRESGTVPVASAVIRGASEGRRYASHGCKPHATAGSA